MQCVVSTVAESTKIRYWTLDQKLLVFTVKIFFLINALRRIMELKNVRTKRLSIKECY